MVHPTMKAAFAACVLVFVATPFTSAAPIVQQAYLKPNHYGSSQSNDQAGNSVAVSGDTMVVGVAFEDSNATGVNQLPDDQSGPLYNSGAAYIYVRTGGTWTQQAYLKPAAYDDSQQGDFFGRSVAISGDTVVIGASAEDSRTTGVNTTPDDHSSGIDSGAAYVFVRSGTTWTQQAYLKPAAVGSTQTGDAFGVSVAISGDTVIIGAPLEDSGSTGVNALPDETASNAGAAYIFTRSGTTWTQQAFLKPAAFGVHQTEDFFGFSVAVSGDTAVVGAFQEDSSTAGVNSTPDDASNASGAAYVFTRSGTVWTQEAYLKPAAIGTTQNFDNFGESIAVSGDTVVVGASDEDSSTTGVNTTPDEAGPESGAAYIFTRNESTWTQRAYLKPTTIGTSQAGDGFGQSVAISGDSVVIGAPGEDSSTTGINSSPNESAAGAGAAYIFTRSGTTWTEESYLKPAAFGTTQAGDFFGTSAAISGYTVIIGATFEDSNTLGVNSTPAEGGPGNGSGTAYVFATLPTVSSVVPAGGSIAGGTNVTVHGTHFNGTKAVTIGGNPVTNLNVVSETVITATTPAHLSGAVDVEVTAAGVGTGSALFTYATPPAPVFVNPPGGSTAGGTVVTIHGSHFIGATGVMIGGSAATGVTVHNDTKITAITPSNSPLLATVTVTAPFTSGMAAGLFTYEDASTTTDTDEDGLSDAAELILAGLGFDRQFNQTSLANSFLSDTGLYTLAQIQVLNIGTPLIQRDPLGEFKLTIGIEKSLTLAPGSFLPFPMTEPQTTINAAGELEFQFTAPDNAAFFRLQAE